MPAGAAVGGNKPQFPARGLTMPDTDEYFVVAEQRLNNLADNRHNEFFEWMLFAAGLSAGALIPSGVALYAWLCEDKPLAFDGFLNCLLLAGGCVAGFVCWRFWDKDKNNFTDIMTKIKAGKRYAIDPGAEIPLRPASEDHGHDPR
ncbi:MAG: hypothetical protein ACK4X1_01930 [Terricaulis sp.]